MQDFDYLHEKLIGTIDILLVESGDIQERLERAMGKLVPLQFDGRDKGVPAAMAPRLEEIRRMAKEGCDDAEAQEAARDLHRMFLELRVILKKD